MRDSNFNSIRSIFNAVSFVHRSEAPEEVCKAFQYQLEREQALIEEYLKLNESFKLKEPNELALHFEEVWQKIDSWLQDEEEEL
jgi:hypothetical protein